MRLPVVTRLLLPLVLAASACRERSAATTGSSQDHPPRADFVLAAGDSAFWITSDSSGVHQRGAPLQLARANGRFYELYVVDDDHSYQGAVLVGQRVYRRDLLSGDSTLVFQDTLVPHLAREYARLHPDDHRLAPDEDPDDQPDWQATATLDLGETHGAFVSYDLHVDVQRGRAPAWHSSRAGVLSVASARAATLADIAGDASARVSSERSAALRDLLDSLNTRGDDRISEVRHALSIHTDDASSFSLTTLDGAPAVEFVLPGTSDGDSGEPLTLPAIPIGQPAWWRDAAASLPIPSADGRRDVWRHLSYEVVARYDASGDARVALRDSTSREWIVGTMSGPASHIYWLDTPALDDRWRHALVRAFDEAATYGEESRVATRDRHPATLLHLARRATTAP